MVQSAAVCLDGGRYDLLQYSNGTSCQSGLVEDDCPNRVVGNRQVIIATLSTLAGVKREDFADIFLFFAYFEE